ncbi:hypothetical protein PFISCL1PPCAC_13199, partial [Pristionchus fissidentatus]
CSSFFKRIMTTGKQYLCRQGNRQCETSIEAEFMCRRCRFDKCVAVGMVYEGPMRVRRHPTTPILQRIKTELKVSLDLRRVRELQLVRQFGCHSRIYHPREELYNVHESTCNEIYSASVAESFYFYKRTFPALHKLSDREQEIIFKNFLDKFYIVESYHRTRQIWGSIGRFIMCSIVTCKDADVPMDRAGFEENKFANSDFLISSARSAADELHSVLLPVFNKSNIVEKEYHALIALLLCELDTSCEVSEAALGMLDRYRQEVLEDLQTYYQNELCLVDYSTRVGNLMTLNHAIQECKSLFNVYLQFYSTIFDVYITDDVMKKFCL